MFSHPHTTTTSRPNSFGLCLPTSASLRYQSSTSVAGAVHSQERRSNLQLTLAVLTALGIVLFPAVLGLS